MRSIIHSIWNRDLIVAAVLLCGILLDMLLRQLHHQVNATPRRNTRGDEQGNKCVLNAIFG